jgi:hypothetical protein
VVALVGLSIGLTGCSPPDSPAVEVDGRGLPRVVNCGSSIGAVEVSDADTGRAVWSASVDTADDGSGSVGDVTLGELVPSWVEHSPLALDPRPSTWRFDVSAGKDTTIVVPDDELRPGRVHRPGGTESASRYDERTCTGYPLSVTGIRVVFAVVVALSIVAALVARALVRRPRPPRP